MFNSWQQWITAFALAIFVAGSAFRLHALNRSGFIAAVLMGTIVVGTGGWWPGVILVAFFATSSALSLISRSTAISQVRGHRRDWIQVLANGWGILLGCILYNVTDFTPWLFFGVGAIAAATADTWSSEIGRTATSAPRLITTWQPVPRGTSGAVSPRGIVASIAGAALIAGLAAAAFRDESSPIITFLGISLAGVLGGLVDSLLGATVQEQRWCDACNERTELNPHFCGHPARHLQGIHGFNNDVVNFLCVLTGTLAGMISGIL